MPTFRGEIASAGKSESVKGRLKPGIELWSDTLDASDFVSGMTKRMSFLLVSKKRQKSGVSVNSFTWVLLVCSPNLPRLALCMSLAKLVCRGFGDVRWG